MSEHCLNQVGKARDVGVNSVVLVPKVPDALKVLICQFLFFYPLLFHLVGDLGAGGKNGFPLLFHIMMYHDWPFSFSLQREMKHTMTMV